MAVKQPTVLIVEDHADTSRLLRRLLEIQGLAVLTAGTVAEARAALASRDVDLIIADRQLPDGTGDDLVAWGHRRSRIPAIALTGDLRHADPARARGAGYCAFLAKPVDFAVLLAEIRKCLPAEPTPPPPSKAEAGGRSSPQVLTRGAKGG